MKDEKKIEVSFKFGCRIPEKYFITIGRGQSDFSPGDDPWETTAYDLTYIFPEVK